MTRRLLRIGWLLAIIVAFDVAAAPSIIERGPHHRVVRHSEAIQLGGRVVERNRDVVELESGMHRWDGGQWAEVSPKLRVVNGAAVADLFYSVRFAPNLATRGALAITLPDGNRLTMHVLGLAYVDGPNSIMIADVKDCFAEIGGPDENELTYRDAFTDFPIDCKFIVRKGSLSQHIRIRSALPPPTDYGLSENAFLEVFTEAIEFPEGTVQTHRWRLPGAEQTEVVDERISFGPMEFVVGKAFFADEHALEGEVPVSKTWSVLEQRTFLRERLPFREIKQQLAKLPQAADARKTPKDVKRLAGGFLPPQRTIRPALKGIAMAARNVDLAAYVVDFELVASADFQLWKGDVTHYVVGALSVKTNVFEGTVIKFAPTNNAKLTITGPVTNYASQYRPVTFTARDDHTIGETIGSAAISGYYGVKALELDWYTAGAAFNLEHFRFRYAQVAVHFNGGLGNVLSHAQFVNCSNAIEQTSSDVSLRNVLIHKANKVFAANAGSTNRGEHLTIHEAVDLHTSGNPLLLLTNSILVAVTNAGTYSGLSNQTASAVGAGFEIVGAGSHYLTNNSVWRDAGSTAINSNLLLYLRTSTTFPPTLYSNTVVSADTHLTKQVLRDTNAPDIGYHAAPLDYAVYQTWVSNCVLSVTNGVAIATFGSGGGFLLQRDTRFVVQGTATDVVEFTPYYTVQEQPLKWGPGDLPWAMVTLNSWWSNGIAPQVSIRFASFDAGGYHLYSFDNPFSGYTNLVVRDCRFSGGNIVLGGIYQGDYAFTNNVFERTYMEVVDARTAVFANNNFRGVFAFLWQMSGSNGLWQFKDNLVDTSAAFWASDCLREYNAFYESSDSYSIQNTNATEMVLTNLVYEAGRFGRWYQPTNSPLINAGSTNNAASVGFYWYTTTTNHTIEGNSVLDIGYHSIGLNPATSEPWDTNEDGTPNYLQDLSGNGITEPDELGGLKMWLKADIGVTNDSGVTGWADQSGNNNHARQTTLTNRPAFISSALNSKPVLRFDGNDDYLNLPLGVTNVFPNAEALIVLKAESATPPGSKGLWRFGTGNSTYPDGSGVVKDSFGRSASQVVGKPAISLTQYHTYNVANTTSRWTARLNGIPQYDVNSSLNHAYATNPRLGSDQSFQFWGDIAEVFLFGRLLSDLDRDELAAYLNQRYALILSAPATPSGLRAIAISSNQISLSWTNGLSTVALRTVVERRTASGTYAIAAIVRNASSYLDSGLLAGTTYYYRLKNVNAAGESPYSVDVNTTTSNSMEQLPLTSIRVWLKSDAGLAASGIRFWEDQSGLQNHAFQDTLVKQPERIAWGVHGKPVVHFDGTDDHLKLPSFATGLSEAEAFIVLRSAVEVAASSRSLWHLSSGSEGSLYPGTDGNVKDDFGRQTAVRATNSAMTLDRYHIYAVSTKTNEWINRWNAQVLAQTTNPSVPFPTDPILGAGSVSSSFFQGDVAEFLFFNRVLNNAERSTVHFYLNDKYGLLDSDGDGLLDKDEIAQGTNPSLTDTNGDGLSDWEDVQVGISATNNDIDGDGVSNAQEILNGTSPFDANTDRDLLNDGADTFPLDPTRWTLPTDTNDITAPFINLKEPTNATPL